MNEKPKCTLHDAGSASKKCTSFFFSIHISMKRKNKPSILITIFSCSVFVMNLISPEVFFYVIVANHPRTV